jgi:hypothetical protein
MGSTGNLHRSGSWLPADLATDFRSTLRTVIGFRAFTQGGEGPYEWKKDVKIECAADFMNAATQAQGLAEANTRLCMFTRIEQLKGPPVTLFTGSNG